MTNTNLELDVIQFNTLAEKLNIPIRAVVTGDSVSYAMQLPDEVPEPITRYVKFDENGNPVI